MLYLVDVRDPVVSQVEVLESLFVLKTLYSANKVVIQVQTLKGTPVLWKSLNLLYFVEREDESIEIY
jgi:hypothetical protein